MVKFPYLALTEMATVRRDADGGAAAPSRAASFLNYH